MNICGADMPSEFYKFESEDILVRGYIENLDMLFDNIRLSIAPLRYGAGLKGKLATSFTYGVPAVGSKIAYEGVNLALGQFCRVDSDDPSDYAKKIIDFYFDQNLSGKHFTEFVYLC